MMAGAPCPVELMKKVMNRLHMPQVTIGYGMTETSPISFQSSMDDPAEVRVATVGRILPHQEVKIVDEQGRIVPRGQSGELLTRGYGVMRGYWGDAKRTAESIPGHRIAGREIWRGSLRLRRAAVRRTGQRGRDPRLLPWRDRALQGAALRTLPRQLSDDGNRQGAEIHAAADDGRRMNPRGLSRTGRSSRAATAIGT